MCMPSTPAARPGPLPMMPAPQTPNLAAADGTRNDTAALLANKGRDSLRIDATTAVPGATPGNGLNIGS